jgi:hypothetical protein
LSIKHQTFDDSATVLFGSVTAGFVDLLALSDDVDMLFIFNTTDAAVTLNMPSGAGVRKALRFPAGSSMAIDCRTNSKRIAKGTIQIKYSVGAPTSGEVTIIAAR